MMGRSVKIVIFFTLAAASVLSIFIFIQSQSQKQQLTISRLGQLQHAEPLMSDDKKGLLLLSNNRGLVEYDLKTSKSRQLIDTFDFRTPNNVSLSPDGKNILFFLPESASTPLFVDILSEYYEGGVMPTGAWWTLDRSSGSISFIGPDDISIAVWRHDNSLSYLIRDNNLSIVKQANASGEITLNTSMQNTITNLVVSGNELLYVTSGKDNSLDLARKNQDNSLFVVVSNINSVPIPTNDGESVIYTNGSHDDELSLSEGTLCVLHLKTNKNLCTKDKVALSEIAWSDQDTGILVSAGTSYEISIAKDAKPKLKEVEDSNEDYNFSKLLSVGDGRLLAITVDRILLLVTKSAQLPSFKESLSPLTSQNKSFTGEPIEYSQETNEYLILDINSEEDTSPERLTTLFAENNIDINLVNYRYESFGYNFINPEDAIE